MSKLISKLRIIVLIGAVAMSGLVQANPSVASDASWATRAKNYVFSWFKKDEPRKTVLTQPQPAVQPVHPQPVQQPSGPLKPFPAVPMPWDKKPPLLTQQQYSLLGKIGAMNAVMGALQVVPEEMQEIVKKYEKEIKSAKLDKNPEFLSMNEKMELAEIVERMKAELEAREKTIDVDDFARGAARGVITHMPGQFATMAGSSWCKQRYGTDYIGWAAPTLCETAAKTIMAAGARTAGKNDKKLRMRYKDFVTGLGADAVMAGLGYYAAKKLPASFIGSSEPDAQQGWMPWLVQNAAIFAVPALHSYIRSTVIKPVVKSVAKSLGYPSILGYKAPKRKVKKSKDIQPGGQKIEGKYYSPAFLAKVERYGNAMERLHQQYQQQQTTGQAQAAG